MKRFMAGCVVLAAMWTPGVWAEEANVNEVIEQIAALGPDALVARVTEIKKEEAALRAEAENLRKQAAEKDAAAEAAKKRVAAVETFLAKMAEMLPPKQAEQPAEKPAEPKPAEAPAEPAPAPAEQPPADGNS